MLCLWPMHRQFLIKKLKSYKGLPEESDSKERMLGFIGDYANCFDRELSIGHITGSAWLLDPSGEKVLLTHHKKLNKWMQLGGHSDGDWNTMTVAMKEAQEESGIDDIDFLSEEIFDIDIHQIPERENEPSHFHFDVRFVLKANRSDFIISEESNDLCWFSKDEIKKMNLEESVKRMTKKWMIL